VPHPCSAVGLEHGDEAVLPGEHEDVVGPVAGDPAVELLLIASRFSLQPSPNGPLPLPLSYDRNSSGVNPGRPGETGSITVNNAVPVAGAARGDASP
jgi:hypothetical protein